MKTVTDNQLNGELGETLVKAKVHELGHVFEGRGRLETGIDGTIEFRDPATGRMLGKTVAVQVKTTHSGAYPRETEASFEYLLRSADLDYWSNTNLPVIIILLRLSDQSFFWKDVTTGTLGDERRLQFDKSADRLNAAAIDRIAQLSVERGRLGSFVPSMRSGEIAHLNLMRLELPDEIFVAESPFRGGRDAMSTLLAQDRPTFDWVIRGRRFVSFRNPLDAGVEAIIEPDTVEAVDTSLVAASDDPDDEMIMIELLRRTLGEQFGRHLAFDREAKVFYFRAPEPLVPLDYRYRSLKEMTSATVVQVYPDRKVPDRIHNVRHHAFAPRFERIGDDWFVSVSPTFYFTDNGSRPHRFGATLLAGKKRLDRNGSIRGQVMLWRYFLANQGTPETSGGDLFDIGDSSKTPVPILRFHALEALMMETAVPEDAWVTSDPNAQRMQAEADIAPPTLWGTPA
jgi:hypothetical protein